MTDEKQWQKVEPELEANRYMLMGNVPLAKKALDDLRIRTIKQFDHNSDEHCNLMMAMLIGREFGLEGVSGMELMDKVAEMSRKIRALDLEGGE